MSAVILCVDWRGHHVGQQVTIDTVVARSLVEQRKAYWVYWL